jgi:hypothetical protein
MKSKAQDPCYAQTQSSSHAGSADICIYIYMSSKLFLKSRFSSFIAMAISRRSKKLRVRIRAGRGSYSQ